MSKKEKQRVVTQTDIAKELNISVVSVSNALSGKKGISNELRQRILDTADELGYKRVEKKEEAIENACNIGVLISGRYLGGVSSCYMSVYRELVLAASKKKMITILEVLSVEEENEMKIPDLFSNEEINGILVLGELKEEYTKKLRDESNVPIVFIDYYLNIPDTDFVASDGYYGTYELTKRLLKAGYREIAFVGTIHATSSITDRYLGYRKAMMEYNIPLKKEWVINDRKLWDNVISVDLPEPFVEAYVCNCDKTAYEVIQEIRKKGYRVPEDIGVTGFDNFLIEKIDGIRLSTYDVDMPAIAEISVNILIRKMKYDDYCPKLRMVSGKVITGNSFLQKR